MIIHTFGDSHSSTVHSAWKTCGYLVSPHHLGPVLCYSFGKSRLLRCDIRKFGVGNGDILVFCFGEIDCRCHIHKHITPTTPYQKIIDDIIANYMEAIRLNLHFCNRRFKAVCVYNVLPPVRKESTVENVELPYLGTNEERKQYVLYFNECLRRACSENGFVFFDIYNDCVDEEGFLRKEDSDGNVHMTNGAILNKFITTRLV